MSVPLADFLRRIKPHVNGCPEITIADTLIDVLRDTCNTCDLWKDDRQMVVVVNGVNAYELDAPPDTEISKVLSVTRENGNRFDGWHHNGRNTLHINYTPGEGQQLRLWVTTSLIPAYGITELPTSVFSELVSFVPFGVAARLQDIPGTNWYAPDLANKNQMKYRSRCNELKIKTMAGFTQANQQATRRRFV
ncbi:hypothetical protein [Salinisphaera sp. G21_0]|uniref:hypothetical protein n=1 Tax=Salinisphaera sp. G21_0 TaxID=2821094 RepID=UPI001ADD0C28|nr:hypothetical protein [Salinisphaera sp. G21_0]MBO9483796.1 hypothetical protein [Salinisphaera sp. G21_0]